MVYSFDFLIPYASCMYRNERYSILMCDWTLSFSSYSLNFWTVLCTTLLVQTQKNSLKYSEVADLKLHISKFSKYISLNQLL